MKTLFRKWYLEILVMWKRHQAQRHYEKWTESLHEFDYYSEELKKVQEEFCYVDFD